MTNTRNYIKHLRNLLIFSAILILLGIILGAIGKQTSSDSFDIFHQLLIGTGGIFTILGFVYAQRFLKEDQLINIILGGSLLIMGIQVFIGQILIRFVMDNWLVGIHYTISAIIYGGILSSITYLFFLETSKEIKLKFVSKHSRRTLFGVALGFLALFSGIYLSIFGIQGTCLSWPLCSNGKFPSDLLGWIVFSHRIIVGFIGLYLVWLNTHSWRTQRSQTVILPISNLFVVIFFAQAFIGALKTVQEFPLYMLVLHELTALIFIGLGFVLVLVTGIVGRSEDDEIKEANIMHNYKQRFRDILALNKPVVVLLLLSTTIAGMIIGAGELPAPKIMVVTIVGGFLAAGGSSAINQYIDRDLDKLMARTANRPLPSGRLTAAEGLAFGVTALVIAFYLLAGFVNILAALLALAGMVYYVIIYSVLLKKKSVNNIVVGGGAGAIPPLVGWAAATGSLNLTSLFLFIIIFLWTPPHFWALALLRKNEYAAANVPMLPVEKGEEATKRMIFQYSTVLVISTLLLWGLGLAGWIYLIGAILLGLYLLNLARLVLFKGRNRIYYKMYRHSNYYLFFLFIFLAIDSVLL